MSQAHPPIPEPQPSPAGAAAPPAPRADEPRTQSILLPPSQRPTGQPSAGGSSAPEAPPPAPGPVTTPGPPLRTPAAPSSAGPRSTPSSTPSSTAGGRSRRSPLAAVRLAGRDRTAALPLGLGVLALGVLEWGLARGFGSQSLWDVVPTWSGLATVAVLVVLSPAVARLTGGVRAGTAWRAGATGLAALALFWVLVALPLASSDRGFWLTAALALAATALWLSPGRPE